MGYSINGVNIEDLAEIAPVDDGRIESPFSATGSKYLYDGSIYRIKKGRKFIFPAISYSYCREIGSAAVYDQSGLALSSPHAISSRGYRPGYNYCIWFETSMYINKFSDGEVWVSTTDNSRSGTRISTIEQNRNCFFFSMCGGGGGGGGSSGGSSAGGGGGGAYIYGVIMLKPEWKHYFYVGGAGAGGGENANGSNGVMSYYNVYKNKTYPYAEASIHANNGYGGKSGGNGGGGGDGGTASYSTQLQGGGSVDTYFHIVKTQTGGNGGAKNNGGQSRSVDFQNYAPEVAQITASSTGGSGPGGGGGGACVLGDGGKGGDSYENGFSARGGGGGGGGGIYVWLSSRTGGNGTKGRVTLYY